MNREPKDANAAPWTLQCQFVSPNDPAKVSNRFYMDTVSGRQDTAEPDDHIQLVLGNVVDSPAGFTARCKLATSPWVTQASGNPQTDAPDAQGDHFASFKESRG